MILHSAWSREEARRGTIDADALLIMIWGRALRYQARFHSCTWSLRTGSYGSRTSSVKVHVPIQFQVTAGATGSITLDFNAAASVQVNQTDASQFILRPVVTPVS